MDETREVEMQKIMTLVENQESVVIMGLENNSKNAQGKAIELFEEKLEIKMRKKWNGLKRWDSFRK